MRQKSKMQILLVPICSSGIICTLVLTILMGADFAFTTKPGLPHFSPFHWWGETTGWKLGWPNFEHYIAVVPFAISAVAMWSLDFLGHRLFQEINYPKKAKKVLMDVDDTMTVASIRQIIGSILGGGKYCFFM